MSLSLLGKFETISGLQILLDTSFMIPFSIQLLKGLSVSNGMSDSAFL